MKKESENKNKKLEIGGRKSDNVRQRLEIGTFLLTSAICLLSSGVLSAGMSAGDVDKISAPPTLEETRLKMDKWLETQQIISRERKDWQSRAKRYCSAGWNWSKRRSPPSRKKTSRPNPALPRLTRNAVNCSLKTTSSRPLARS